MRVWKVRKALVNFSRTFYLGSLYDDIYIERERNGEIRLREILANDFYKVLELIKNWNETLSFKEFRRIRPKKFNDRND